MKILFVCTGNTCRSPMANGIFQKIISDKGFDKKFISSSAGFSAVSGMSVSENAVCVCDEIGINIRGHKANKFSRRDVGIWDAYFPMSKTHGYILKTAGVPTERIYVPKYIDDPYGGDINIYRQCRDKLRREVDIFFEYLMTSKEDGITNDN